MSDNKSESISVSETFPVSATLLYNAWLDSDSHSKFTGGAAVIEPLAGASFTAWDNYISGKNIELVPYKRIIKSWRADDFPEGAEDSLLELNFIEIDDKTTLIINHSNIPEGMGPDYKQGWLDYYFKPMKEYFSK